jgi:hypothetical protein
MHRIHSHVNIENKGTIIASIELQMARGSTSQQSIGVVPIVGFADLTLTTRATLFESH